ncbi:hypothetical protein QBC37DRAFT_374956 [Rhypophila decipiens]|uniref:Uncharacterized protein n=1 Tax=Rhypophila decipiens TaxID=261697 RepID=A0AAN6Y617_9PEZI|nr:hypothetical protein QBC37DRAFT_374956 [Rhypophila decipiens]
MASCGGCVLSGFLFAGIGEVKGLTGQWISQGFVAFGSLTSLFYTTLHIRASRLGNTIYASSTSTVGFEHPLESQAVLTIRAAFLLWLSALPAISMGILHGGRTILKLDLFISTSGFLCTSFLVFIVERMESAFELPLFSPTPAHAYSVSLLGEDLEAAALRGGKGKNTKNKGKGSGASFSIGSSASSFTFTASSSSSGASSPTRAGGGRRIITVPAPSYGPRAHPGKGADRRVLTRLSVINAMVPPAQHHAASPPTPPQQQGTAAGASPSSARSALSTASNVASAAATKLTPIAAGVASTVSGWIWGGGNKPAAVPSGAGSGPQQAQQQQQMRAVQQPQEQAVRHGDDGGMPGGYYAGHGGGHGW